MSIDIQAIRRDIQLRELRDGYSVDFPTINKLCDEIERLRAQVETLQTEEVAPKGTDGKD